MNQIQKPTAFQSFIQLISWILGFTILTQIVAILLIYLLKRAGGQPFSMDTLLEGEWTLRLSLALSSLGTFIVPAFMLQYQHRYLGVRYFEDETPRKSLNFILIFLIMVIFMPAMSWIANWNEHWKFPESFDRLQQWIQSQEQQTSLLLEPLIANSSIFGLFSNLIILALLPAIGEELVFRGCLQYIFGKWIRNHHLVIWVVAIIFSTIHFQFLGFVPRMLLGAFFGYVYHWTKSIYFPIFAHFINNGYVVVMSFYYLKTGKTIEQLNTFEPQSTWIYVVSVLITTIFIFALYRLNELKNKNGERLDEN